MYPWAEDYLRVPNELLYEDTAFLEGPYRDGNECVPGDSIGLFNTVMERQYLIECHRAFLIGRVDGFPGFQDEYVLVVPVGS